MIQVKNSTQYYINERALTFSENDLDNPNRVAVSLVSGTVILVHVPGTIDFAASGNYDRWTLKGHNTRLVNNAAHYVYARLNRANRSALVVFSVNNYNIDGSITTVTGKDENGEDITSTTEPSGDYYFIRIGGLTATDGSSYRELTYDSGLLSTDKGNSSTDPNDMWELDQYTTPWLIRAKHWLTSFTLKGFLTFIGGFIFKKDGGEEKRIVDIMRTTDSGDPNESNYVPIDDTTIPTTAWVLSRSEDRYLKKYEPDETQYRIKFFDGIECGHFVKGMIGGSGTQFDGDGYGEMNGLTLREFLEVPELRFNRIDVVSGELWNSVGFGLIESVDTEKQIAVLKLEGKERAGLHVYDICRGIFADFGDGTQWEGEDECGFQHLYGFWTSYFTPTEIITSGEGVFEFRYALKPGTTQHPTASMKFAVYGNFVDKNRQASAYSTRTYKRYLNNVDTWVVDPDKHIYAQYGDLEGLTIGGYEMHGYGSFQSNSYFTGVQIHFTPQQKLELKGEDSYTAVLSDYEGVVTIDDEGNIVGGELELQNVVTEGENVITSGENVVTAGYKLRTQVQAMRGSTALFYSPTTPGEGSYVLSIGTVGCTAMVLNGMVVVTSVFNTERCFVTIVVNCEGKASFTLTYHITAIRDGKNPIVADIDNEMDSVACDSSGKVLFGLPVSCTVSMWAGTGKLDLDRLEVSAPEGVTYTADKTTGIIRVTAITQEAERALPLNITAYASYGGTQYHKDLVFTVNKVNAGENALLYKLSPSASSVKVDDAGVMTAESIRCEVVASDGSTIRTLDSLPAGVTMQYYRGDETPKDYTYNSAVSVTGSTKTVTFKLYSEGQLIDVETIPILLDGSSPLIVDLDNEMQSVACDEHGNVVLGLPLSTGVKAFYGSKELDITSLTVGSVTGVTASVSGTTVTVTEIAQSVGENIRIPITVKATHDKEYTRTVHLIVNKLKQGDSAVVVDLVPSVSAVKVDAKGTFTPTSVSCVHKVTTGKNGASTPAAIQENYSMKYAIDGDTTPDAYTYGSSVSTVSAKTSITFYLYYKGVLVDRETIPVVKDGASPVKLDLDNEMQSVACDENGNVTLGLPLSTGVKMYYGTEAMAISSLTVTPPAGVTVTKTTSSVTVTAITAAAAETLKISISATASYGSETYTKSATLTVNKLKQGNSAVVLDLSPSVTAIKVTNAGSYTPTSVSCKVKQTTGKNGATTPSALPSGYSMKYRLDSGSETAYTYGNSVTVTSATASVTFFLYYGSTLVDRETIPVVKDGNNGTNGKDGTNGTDGKDGTNGTDGADAEYYTVEAAVASIGYTMIGGYSPSQFIVSEYHVKGATKVSSNKYYIFIYGVKSTGNTYLTYTSMVQEYTFNAGSYQSYNYDSFLFELRQGSSSSSTLVASTTVSVAKQGAAGDPGSDGNPGPMARYCGIFQYNTGVTYVYDSEYRDIVVYNGNVYQVLARGMSVPDTTLPTNTSYWEQASKFSFVAMDTALIDNANIAGFTFTRSGYDSSGNPVGVLASQNGALELDAANGEITVSSSIVSGTFTVNYVNTVSANGFSVSDSYGVITSDFGLKNLYFEDSTWLTAVNVQNNQSTRRSDDMCGIYLGMASSDICICAEGGTNLFHPAEGNITSIYGLSVRARRSVSGYLTSIDDFVEATGNITLPAASTYPGKVIFVKCNGSITISGSLVRPDEYTNVSSLTFSGRSVMFVSNGTRWICFACYYYT